MALSKKQSLAIGVLAAAVVAAVGIGVAVGVNRPAEAVAAPEPSVSAPSIEWVHTDAVPAAVEALEASGFTPIEPGKLTVAVGAFVPPLSYVPEGETLPSGTEPNIGSLIAEGLGLEYNPVVVAWADWPLGIQSGKYDLITANVTVTEERKELYDFASYRQDLLGFAVRADSPIEKIESADDISGLKIVVGSGTNQEKVLLNWNEELVAAGEAPADLQYYDDTAAATLALLSGRVDATFGPNATAAWAARDTGETKIVGVVPGGYPLQADIAAGTRKGNGLVEPVQIVLNDLIANGTYAEVLKTWNLTSEGIETSQINPPGLPKS